MGTGVVTIEPVESKTALRRFTDVPFILHRRDPRWSPEVRAYESWRLDARRHPYFDRGDAAYLLARRDGHPVGRIAAHRQRAGDVAGWFGFFDGPDDAEVTRALLDAARTWLEGEGATSMTGPVSWQPDEEFGVLVDGVEHRGLTGRPWRPGWYAEQLRCGRPRARRRPPHLPAGRVGVRCGAGRAGGDRAATARRRLRRSRAGARPDRRRARCVRAALGCLDPLGVADRSPGEGAAVRDRGLRALRRPPDDLVPGSSPPPSAPVTAGSWPPGLRRVIAPETTHQVFSLVF